MSDVLPKPLTAAEVAGLKEDLAVARANGVPFPAHDDLERLIATVEASEAKRIKDANDRWEEVQRHRAEALRRVKARGLDEGELQWRWRTNPPEMYDKDEVMDAILDALNREGVVAWQGDGTHCVEEIVRAQAGRAERYKAELESLRAKPLPSDADGRTTVEAFREGLGRKE